MEKQMAFFQMEDNDESTIWPRVPEKNQQKIENIFAKILIKYLSSSWRGGEKACKVTAR